MMVRITKDRKMFVFGLRIHHWPFGIALAGLGTYVWWTDKRDFFDWLIR